MEKAYRYEQWELNIDGLVQERRNSIANALELRLSCINPSTCELHEPRIFYPSGHWPETVANAHVSAHFR